VAGVVTKRASVGLPSFKAVSIEGRCRDIHGVVRVGTQWASGTSETACPVASHSRWKLTNGTNVIEAPTLAASIGLENSIPKPAPRFRSLTIFG